jgi:YVTN family beta-propeller protein
MGGAGGTGGGGSGVYAYAASASGMSTLVPIDLVSGMALPSLTMGAPASYPYDATIRPGGAEVWIVGASGAGVVIVDTATNSVITSVNLAGMAEYPVGVGFSADGNTAYVSSRDSEVVARIDAQTYTLLGTDPLPGALEGGKLAVDPCSGLVYLTDWFDGSLLIYDPSVPSFTEKVFGNSLWAVAVSADGDTVYVTDRNLDVVHVYDVATGTTTGTAPTGDDPWGLAITPNDAMLVVANEDSGNVTFIDTSTLAPTTLALPAGAAPRDVEIDAAGQFAYVVSGNIAGNDAVYKIDLATKTIVGTIDLGISINVNVIAVAAQPGPCVP